MHRGLSCAWTGERDGIVAVRTCEYSNPEGSRREAIHNNAVYTCAIRVALKADIPAKSDLGACPRRGACLSSCGGHIELTSLGLRLCCLGPPNQTGEVMRDHTRTGNRLRFPHTDGTTHTWASGHPQAPEGTLRRGRSDHDLVRCRCCGRSLAAAAASMSSSTGDRRWHEGGWSLDGDILLRVSSSFLFFSSCMIRVV